MLQLICLKNFFFVSRLMFSQSWPENCFSDTDISSNNLKNSIISYKVTFTKTDRNVWKCENDCTNDCRYPKRDETSKRRFTISSEMRAM